MFLKKFQFAETCCLHDGFTVRAKISIRRKIFRTLSVCFVLYLVAAILVTARQRKFIYFPPVFDTETVNLYAANERMERWTNSSGQTVGWKHLSATQPAEGQILIM